MTTTTRAPGAPHDAHQPTAASGHTVPQETMDVRIKLAALWLFVLLNIIFRDIHQFALKSHLEMLLTGTYNGVVITEELMLFGAVIVQIPVGMVPLSVWLGRRAGRPVKFVAVVLATVGMLSNAPTDLDDWFHLIIQLLAMAAIVRLAWLWTGPASRSA
ncbi:MAG: DUF6326 family protein [Pseudomonadota bacterium]